MLLLIACTRPVETRPAGTETAVDSADTSFDSADSSEETGTPEGPCGTADMVLIGAFCMDRWEAHLLDASPYEVPTEGIAATAAGAVPQGYISGEVAATACAAAGKRLCTSDEWLLACAGSSDGEGRTYPYGDTYSATACNTEYAGDHPVCDYFGTCDGVWDSEHMNDPGINQQPGTVALSGAFEACSTPEGVWDLHGNLHEWVADSDGTFRGGFFADASINGAGCSYKTGAHDFSYHDYSTGFRCCADPAAD